MSGTPGAACRRAATMLEVLLGIAVLSLGLIPLVRMLVFGSQVTVSARLALMAQQLARETVEELRQIPFDRLEEYAAIWRDPVEVAGSPWEATRRLRPSGGDRPDPGDSLESGTSYPEEYRRLRKKVTVSRFRARRLVDRGRRVAVEITWEEGGAGRGKERPGLLRYESIVVDHRVEESAP